MAKVGRPRKTRRVSTGVSTEGIGGFGLFELKCKYCQNTALVSEGTKSRICALCLMKLDGFYPVQEIEAMKGKKKEDH